MKMKRLISFFCVMICMLAMTLPAFARASDQLEDYWMEAGTSDGQILVSFSVTGSAKMDRIGCESIEVYEDTNGRWKEVESLDEFDEGMSDRNSRGYINTIYIDGEVGSYYKVIVTIFAEDENGRDAREEAFYVTCRS